MCLRVDCEALLVICCSPLSLLSQVPYNPDLMDDPADRAAVGRMRRESYVAAEAALGLGPRRSVITYAASDTTGPVTETMQSLDSGPTEGTPARVRTGRPCSVFNGVACLANRCQCPQCASGMGFMPPPPTCAHAPNRVVVGILIAVYEPHISE